MSEFVMRFLPDEPVDGTTDSPDVLKFDQFVELIHGAIKNTEPPFVYGVLGDWGVGKTSILRILKRKMLPYIRERDVNLVPIWFNPWKYENETNIVYPLLYAIKKSYEKEFERGVEGSNIHEALRSAAWTSAFVLGDIGLRAATKFLTGDAYKLEDLETYLKLAQQPQGDFERVLSSWADKVGEFQDAFAALLDRYAEALAAKTNVCKDSIRFVILVDDLDRCLPDTSIAILESIKNLLTVDKAIFVLALNPQIVYQGIQHKYHGLQINGREYLEKILNYTFYVPVPELERVREFATQRISDLVPDKEQRKPYKVYFSLFGDTLADCNFNNPRKIKRILNRYLLFLSRDASKYDVRQMHNVVRMLILAEYFPDVFQEIGDSLKEKRRIGDSIDTRNLIKDKESLFKKRPQLSQMRNLLELHDNGDINHPDLRVTWQDVYGITRLG